MPEVLGILAGGFLPVASAYALGRFLLRRFELPGSVALAVGAAVLSHAVFLLMLARAATLPAFLALGVAALALGFLGRKPRRPSASLPADRGARLLLLVVLPVYGALYAVHALAPETQPDGYSYHLALPAEWLRLRGFAGRIGFYEILPQGLEMLFVFAFAIGRHSAAKLVHLAFLAATIPLLFATGRRLRVPEWVPGAAAVLYFCSPVVGASGAAAYNDAALVFYALAAFHLALAWEQERDDRLLFLAGLTAGFCYAIKFTGLVVAPPVIGWAVVRRRRKAAAAALLGAALTIAPWMGRNLIWTRNPFAPLFNSLFPNRHFHVVTEQNLGRDLRSYQGVTPGTLPLEITVRGMRLQGLTGPVFLLAPLALLALRRKEGRIVLAAAGLMAAPWLFNIGARFVMPSLVFLALGLAIALPRRFALACAAFHALVCLPPAAGLYADRDAWRLRGFPWRAALRLEPEQDYLRRALWEYRPAEMVNRHVPAGERVLDLAGTTNAYVNAVAVAPWQSASGDRAGYALKIGIVIQTGVFCEAEADWPERELRAVRISQTGSSEEQWGVNEVEFFRGSDRVQPQPGWRFTAKPMRWEAGLAFDGNLVSRWGTWAPARPEAYLAAEFDQPQRLTGVRAVLLGHEQKGDIVFEGREPDGAWKRLSEPLKPAPLPALNMRRSVNRLLRHEGFRYILAPRRPDGWGPVTASLAERPSDWGVEALGETENVYLFRLR
ncbi:MAG: glycosyltransferase family 39 protein [Bryobacteraceae bacterium]|nr:glycosyltransferase family 39 protein [Bryobacteraceae bacterium]